MWRQQLGDWIAQPRIERALIALIIINAVILGLETSPSIMAVHGSWLKALDMLILSVFVVELALRIIAHGGRFFRDPWSLFDFAVVAIALVPASGPLAVLRTLRVLRVLRILTLMPSMRRVVGGLVSAIPGLSSVVLLMGLIFYVAAVVATGLFGGQFPQWFGGLGETAYTLFQVMTLESWSMGIARPVIEAYPFAWVFFVIFILVTTFTMLNLFIAVIVNATQAEHDVDNARHVEDQHDQTRAEVRALSAEIATLKAMLENRHP
ncbi:ion transporter [Granulosicoccus sp. 3-233]|uniref:ion transporter n=1 Tax=Granulosicoccus sp. 3-233 TaxID=3417969 RepID=UPI003D352E17